MFSYWERETFWKRPDAVVIGSGIVGLNAAIRLKELAPALDVRVVERGFLPYGASTRNAGFACFGSVSELSSDLNNRTMAEVAGLVKKRWEGLAALRKIIGDETMDYQPLGGYEVFRIEDELEYQRAVAAIPDFNSALSDVIGVKEVFSDCSRRITDFGLRGIRNMIFNCAEGQLDTGKMMEALMTLAASRGVKINTGVQVLHVEESDRDVTLLTPDGFRLRCGNVLYTTNGLTLRLVSGLDVQPARAQVLLTEPVNGLRLKGAFHFQEGYYYFRNVGDRILLGGARNTDFNGEHTDVMGLNAGIQDRLENFLYQHILPDEKTPVEMRWSGIMGIGMDKAPIIRRLSERTWCSVKMGGMGVAIGTTAGRELAELFSESL